MSRAERPKTKPEPRLLASEWPRVHNLDRHRNRSVCQVQGQLQSFASADGAWREDAAAVYRKVVDAHLETASVRGAECTRDRCGEPILIAAMQALQDLVNGEREQAA